MLSFYKEMLFYSYWKVYMILLGVKFLFLYFGNLVLNCYVYIMCNEFKNNSK